MKIKIKKLHPDAVVPKYAKPGDAGMDLTSTSKVYDPETGTLTYGTGLALEIPKGYVGLLFSRSSVYKKDLDLCNSVGVLDSKFRGEIMFKFRINRRADKGGNDYNIGDRIGQLIIMPYPEVEFEEVEELSETDRGDGGFGSSGN